jgi:NAD-dependent SIR2 family protein deacetylase
MDRTDEGMFQELASLIRAADAIAVFAGAGMGVDSGLEQYRGMDGLWTRSLRINNKEIPYTDLMKPEAFRKEPGLAWGFVSNRIASYQNTVPHEGYSILQEWLHHKEYFIVTSNVDEQFQKSGFHHNRIFELHGSLFNTQCMYNAECGTWRTPHIKMLSDGVTADTPYPSCPICNSFCRPNVYLFDDDFFLPDVAAEQQFRYMEWREYIGEEGLRSLTLEIGAGETIPTIRKFAERFTGTYNTLVRINPHDHGTDRTNYRPVPFGAREGLIRINKHMDGKQAPF